MEEIKVYDKNGQQVTMLVQWDLDVYLYVNEEEVTKAYNVHLFNTENDVAYVVESTYSDGFMKFKIPNRLLFSDLPITGYIYVLDDDGTYRSIFVFTVLVRGRAVPSDFAYINDDSDDYINVEKVLAECIAYAESAAASADESQYWTNLSKSWAVGETGLRDGEDTDNSKYYYLHAAQSAEVAAESAISAADSRDAAAASEANAAASESNAAESATMSKSYAVGGTDTREDEDFDNAKYYHDQCELLAESFSGALRPMGTVTFEELPSLEHADAGDMYNISDEFTTTDDFEEGEGHIIPLGSNVYKTVHEKWDVLAGSPVTGVKGDAEDSYRRGNVNLTLDNLGISAVLGDDITEDDIDEIFDED